MRLSRSHASCTASSAGAPQDVLELTALRASQINGCGACVYSHVRNLRKAGESDERIGNVAAWQEAPFYTEAERRISVIVRRVQASGFPGVQRTLDLTGRIWSVSWRTSPSAVANLYTYIAQLRASPAKARLLTKGSGYLLQADTSSAGDGNCRRRPRRSVRDIPRRHPLY
ncbi:carboxymuconolactone decarboxylase family protein [Microbispora siamensis]